MEQRSFLGLNNDGHMWESAYVSVNGRAYIFTPYGHQTNTSF